MTHVEMIYDNNIIIGFKMKGHAGFNLNGPDILCASLSTASQMTINGILDWSGLSLDDILVEENKSKATLHVNVPAKYVDSIIIQLFKSFELYISMLEEQYKDYVKLERR